MAWPLHYTASFCLYSAAITLAIAVIPCLVQSVTLESDIEALQSLKNAIDPNTIPASSFLSTWNFQADPCESSGGQFQGILCTVPLNSISRVLALDLDVCGYEGFLAPAIGNLTQLTTLNLRQNKFRGPIPTTISNLQKLTKLSLSMNFFTGNLPPRIYRLKKLEVLDLQHNELSGSILPVMSELRSLTHIGLSDNQFTGTIPNLAALRQLNTLDLSRNHLHGNLPRLPTNLRTLLLCHNMISGQISTLRRMENLETLDLSDNKFSGSISHELLTLPKINHINISTNSFSTLEVIGNSGGDTQLQVLDVHGNRVRGRLPVNLVTYGNLTEINLGNNRFSGRIPVEYGQRLGGEWRSLFLDHNFLVGSVPPEFTAGEAEAKGSLAQNCLHCRRNIRWCRGGQRLASQCA